MNDGLNANIEALFRAARSEWFEDGMESNFSVALTDAIQEHGIAAVEAIENTIFGEIANAEVCSEALRWLGYIDHAPSCQYRFSLLKLALRSPSARVRDGALLGLSYMDDPDALDDLRLAIKNERVPELRGDMKQALRQLLSEQLLVERAELYRALAKL